MKTLREYSLYTKRSISVKPRDFHHRCTLSVGTQHAGTNIDALRLAIRDIGYNEVTDEHDRDITWNGAYFFKSDRRRKGFVNKFPGIHCLLTKIGLFGSLEFQRKLFPEAYNFYPPTWFLPYQYDYWNAYTEKQIPGCVTYIVKPSAGTQGKGIYLVQSPREYCDHEVDVALASQGQTRRHPGQSREPPSCLAADSLGYLPAKEVVQRYEDHPVLVDGHKADLRIYVVLESISPLRIHVYRDGLVRLASQRYEPPDPVNMHKTKMHLTNYSINKFSDAMEAEEMAHNANAEGEGEREGHEDDRDSSSVHSDTCINTERTTPTWRCKLRLRNFLRRGSAHYRKRQSGGRANSCRQWDLDPKVFWARVDELVRNTMFALVPYIRVAYWAECLRTQLRPDSARGRKAPHCFQIFGFDLLLVEPDFRPVLLEVNSSPSLRIDCMRPLVQPSSCKHGLNPAIIHSPKYAAFSRSRVDEQVKTGLLRATLSLIGSRLLFERMSVDSPEKAYAFLNACGYKTPFIPMEPKAVEPVEEQDNDKKAQLKRSAESQSLPRLTQKSSPTELRTLRRHNTDFPSQWMHDRLSQIYDLSRKPRSPKVPSLEVQLDEIVPRSPPSWPSVRKRTLSAVYGRQHANERLTASFLDRRRLANCRDSRNLLHCIYSEDNVYFPYAPEGESTHMTESEVTTGRTLSSLENTSLNPGSFAQTYPSFEASKATEIFETAAGGDTAQNDDATSPENSNSLQVEPVLNGVSPQDQPIGNETMAEISEADGIAEPNENQSNAQSWPKTPLAAKQRRLFESVTTPDLRLLDKLADIFITILSERRLVEQQLATGIDHCSSANFPYVIHLDSSGRTLSGHHVHRLDCTLGVEVLTPRMDSSGFRSFFQRCQLRHFGMNIHDVELMYMKHKMFWFRVYEFDCAEAESGICFSAFVELCVQLASKHFWPNLPSVTALKSGCEGRHPAPTAEMLRLAVTSFVEHCVESLKLKSLGLAWEQPPGDWRARTHPISTRFN
ncbi:Tubulin polyglutamylase ttll11 [Sparganum proliferum]